jgi:hypothetical protein
VVCVETNLTNLGAAAELALDMVDVGSLCNQCGDTELGDDWKCVTVDCKPNLPLPGDGAYLVTLTTPAPPSTSRRT